MSEFVLVLIIGLLANGHWAADTYDAKTFETLGGCYSEARRVYEKHPLSLV